MRAARSAATDPRTMTTDHPQLPRQWQTIVTRLSAEIADLPPEERAWITAELAGIARLQGDLHRDVRACGGEAICAICVDNCCDRGKNHLTLVTALFALLDGGTPPFDATAPCPQLGPAGCLLVPEQRPFNCITFNCEAVESRLPEAAKRRIAAIERELRRRYLRFDRRYAGSSLRGLLIRAARLGPTPFLSRIDRRPDPAE